MIPGQTPGQFEEEAECLALVRRVASWTSRRVEPILVRAKARAAALRATVASRWESASAFRENLFRLADSARQRVRHQKRRPGGGQPGAHAVAPRGRRRAARVAAPLESRWTSAASRCRGSPDTRARPTRSTREAFGAHRIELAMGGREAHRARRARSLTLPSASSTQSNGAARAGPGW